MTVKKITRLLVPAVTYPCTGLDLKASAVVKICHHKNLQILRVTSGLSSNCDMIRPRNKPSLLQLFHCVMYIHSFFVEVHAVQYGAI